jgi:YebC/PmpR family DNA-binding regulatory protein
MSGHSKWSTIKRKKGAIDAARGKVFTKLVREITTAARMGGGDVNGNPRLRLAVAAAKAESMPGDNITRAIKKGTGELEGATVEDSAYEGYAAGGVAVFVEAQTDNKNRTSSDVRTLFNKFGGNMGAAGSVGWMFKRVGLFTFDAAKYSEDELMEAALEAGADDVKTEADSIVVTCDFKAFADVLDKLDKRALKYSSAELTMVPDNYVKVSGDAAARVLKLVEGLEELDDVQKVHANFDIDEAELERLAASS